MVLASELGIKIHWDDSEVKHGSAKTESDIEKFVDHIKDHISQGIGMALGNFGFEKITEGFKEVVKGMIEGNAQMEDYTVQFSVLLGSADKAKTKLADLAKFARDTPFELPEVVESSRLLEVFGGKALDTTKMLTLIGDAASGVGQPFKDLAFWIGRTYTALKGGQPIGEMTMRLIEMGVISGETKQKLDNLTKTGGKSAEAWDIVSKALSRFSGHMDEQSRTWKGMMSNLSDTKDQILREIGAPFFEEAKKGLGRFLEYVSSDAGKQTVKTIVEITGAVVGLAGTLFGMMQLSKGISFVTGAFKAVAGAIGEAGGIINIVRAAFTALTGPVGIVIALAGALYLAWKDNLGGFRDFVDKTVKDAIGFFGGLADYVKDWVKDNKDTIIPAWEFIKKNLAEIFKTVVIVAQFAWDTIKQIIAFGLDTILSGIKIFAQLLNGDWSGAWDTFKDYVANTWNRLQAIITSGIIGILKLIDQFGDEIAGVTGQKFTGLDNSIKLYEDRLKDLQDGLKMTGHQAKATGKDVQDAFKKMAGDSGANVDFNKIFGGTTIGNKSKGGGSAGKALARGLESGDVTESLLESLARSIKTPKGQASCGFFASEMLRQIGVQIPKGGIGGAKALGDALLSQGGRVIPANLAKPGDLVREYGRQYGAVKDSTGQGYHVGVYTGNGRMVDSSNGKTRFDQMVNYRAATFIRPNSGRAEVQDISDANKGLLGIITQLTERQRNLTDTTDKAKLSYRLFKGDLAGADGGLKKWALTLQDTVDKQEKAKVTAESHREALHATWKSILQTKGATDSQIFAWQRAHGELKDLTDAQYKTELSAIQYREEVEKNTAAEKERQGAFADSVAAMDNLDKKTKQFAVTNEILFGKYKNLNAIFKAMIVAQAVVQDSITEQMKNVAGFGDDPFKANTQEMEDQQKSNYEAFMKGINQEWKLMGMNTHDALVQQIMWDEHVNRSQATTMANAKEQLDKIKKFKEMVHDVSSDMASTILGSIKSMNKGFSGFWNSLIQGFRQTFNKIAQDYLQSQLTQSMTGGIGSILGSLFGGGKGLLSNPAIEGPNKYTPFYHAYGGDINPNEFSVVGEHGPELLKPKSSGEVITNAELSRMMRSGDNNSRGGDTIYLGGLNLNGVTDYSSFKKNENQLMASLEAKLTRARLRNGAR